MEVFKTKILRTDLNRNEYTNVSKQCCSISTQNSYLEDEIAKFLAVTFLGKSVEDGGKLC